MFTDLAIIKIVYIYLSAYMVSVFCFFRFYSNAKDIRQRDILIKPTTKLKKKYFKHIQLDKPYKVLNLSLPLDSFFLFSSLTSVKTLFSTTMLSNDINITFSSLYYYWFFLMLRFNLFNLYFLEDLSSNISIKDLSITLPVSSYFTNTKIIGHISFKNDSPLHSLSLVFSSFNWVEREASEFFKITFNGLLDSRRLLTDYTKLSTHDLNYKTLSYNERTQTVTNIKVLHWIYLLSYFTLVCLISLIFLNKNLFSLLILSEIIIILIYILHLILASCLNIYYLIGFAFFILVLGGLELTINILILLAT